MRRIASILLLGSALVGAWPACAKDLDALAPYHCPKDGTCPMGLTCDLEKKCTPPVLDGICQAGTTNCATAASGATCLVNACTQVCGADGKCATPGHLCVFGKCLADCGNGEACPAPLVCTDLKDNGKKACVDATLSDWPIWQKCPDPTNCEAAGLACSAGFCTAPCDQQRQCPRAPKGFICAGDGYCYSPCPCPAGLFCSKGTGTARDPFACVGNP